MGHYAGEMGYPATRRETPEHVNKRRSERLTSLRFRWDLDAKREEQGDWRSGEKLSCPICAAVVRAQDRVQHDDWHNGSAA